MSNDREHGDCGNPAALDSPEQDAGQVITLVGADGRGEKRGSPVALIIERSGSTTPID